MQPPSKSPSSTVDADDAALPGPRVVRLFGSSVAVLWVAAWWSWGLQARCLVGRHGLLPLAEFFAHAHLAHTPNPISAPSIFWILADDWTIVATIAAGVVAATLAAFDIAPKKMLATNAVLFVSFMAPAAPFFPMLADRLLLEATALALLLPRNRPTQALQWFARGLLFKLYIEIGLAQWLSSNNVWKHGLALSNLLQTTALPTPFAFWASQLPEGLLGVATKGVVLTLLIVPFFALGSRVMRLVAAVLLTVLQLVVALLCNFGLFCWVAQALHLFLLSDHDVARLQREIGRLSPHLARLFGRLTRAIRASRPWGALTPLVARLKGRIPKTAPLMHQTARGTATLLLATGYLVLSLVTLLPELGLWVPGPRLHKPMAALGQIFGPWHLVNTYAGLDAPNTERTEPIVEALVGETWRPLYLWHQPSDPWAGPKFVAPHQPRLDVMMSSFGRGQRFEPLPRFVGRMMEMLCDEPLSLQKLYQTNLPLHPRAIRISLWQYRFADLKSLADEGRYWQRHKVTDGPRLMCRDRQPH